MAQAGAILGHFRRQLTEYDRIIELTPTLFAEAMLVLDSVRQGSTVWARWAHLTGCGANRLRGQ